MIVLIGENRSFDNVFATYRATGGQPVANLLSKGIILLNGDPGPNFRAVAAIPGQPALSVEILH